MTPCEDVQTIHASQNDNEAREWGFELHNNGEKIDSSSISDQLVFKAYKGGTEEILPTNGSVPTTSPFLGDIRYPQGLLTDQEFTYRQSPTQSDGNAKIQAIYGNTLKWNQLINDTGSTTTTNGITFTKNADGSITLNGTATAQAEYNFERIDYVNGHNYLITGIPSGATVDGYKAFVFSRSVMENTIITTTRDDWFTPRIRVSNGVTVSNVVFRLNIFDLTEMFGAGNEPSTVEEFTSLFPLHYAYNTGTLLSFNGTGLKTVGFNQWDEEWELGNISADTGVNSPASTIIRSKNYIPVFPNTLYYCHVGSSPGATFNIRARFYDAEKNYIGSYGIWWYNRTYTIPDNAYYMRFVMQVDYGSIYKNDICINISDAERNGTYEPYTSSTTNLPISTYFPTGMKSKGDTYDELTETKAITRIGSRAYQSGDESDTSVITDGTTTYYALATPTETSFTTASLVTENAEIPLSNDDGTLIGKCTEELSAEPGFHDAKIKLSDSDGDVYSNKIQLHVERSPQ